MVEDIDRNECGLVGMEVFWRWLSLIDFAMFHQQFYLDFHYTDGLTGLTPKRQFEDMYLLILGQPEDLIPT